MCGNFGLLLLKQSQFQVENQINDSINSSVHLDDSVHESMQRVASTDGLRIEESNKLDLHQAGSVRNESSQPALLDVVDILEAQTANTELRGGQAGGFSSISYPIDSSKDPQHKRIRCVARKRYPLSRDLASLYQNEVKSSTQNDDFVSVIGHTRFATSSVNIRDELHPHQWSPFSKEEMWRFNYKSHKFDKSEVLCGVHLTHNGDFDALEMYDETVTVNDVGLWLEKVLHVQNLLNGDSPKLAGCMELFHVQGRWAKAARLAWVRVILHKSGDVCDGPLLRSSPSLVPNYTFWKAWGEFFDSIWIRHINNVIIKSPKNDCTYKIDRKAEQLLSQDIVGSLCTGTGDDKCVVDMKVKKRKELNCSSWSRSTIQSFVAVTIRGVLLGDLYNSLSELLSRATGSFGVQVHSPCEPGVVCIASKGQPMSIAFDSTSPIILFGSEATALTISVTKSGQWLRSRIDLDSQGEVMRLGRPKALIEGSFSSSKESMSNLLLPTGIEIRSYSLVRATETLDLVRAIPIVSVPPALAPGIDQVEADLLSIPTVIAAIDSAWGKSSVKSAEARTSSAFCSALIESMKHRLRHNQNTLDLVITGVEVSLWMGESFANDLKMIFPQISVCVISANKMLGLGSVLPHKVYFAGSSTALEHQIDRQHTICLLISQSGQTFPTLHAAYSFAAFVESDKLWLITGTFNSKIENVIVGECFKKKGTPYVYNRVFNNYSGHRPAEPSSVAAAATWHTLSHIILRLVELVRGSDSEIIMLLSSGCIGDLRSLMLENVVDNLQKITQKGEETHTALVKQGKAWGAHIAEPWTILVFVCLYILLSVGLGLPIFGLLGDAVLSIVRACGGLENTRNYKLIFSLRYPSLMSQPWGWTFVGAILQAADALWFVFLAKVFTWGDRWYQRRAIGARMGKRCIVIVDQPVVHQMLENYVSKLYSQAYSFLTPEVHGSCGTDHFVHRFTHRVVRGLLIAVGRPDGRLGCLSKSENAIILATKQAAFIRNPAYSAFDGSAPEIITVSHNPFIPSFHGSHIIINSKRRKFLEEVLFEKLHQDAHPFTLGILKSIAEELEGNEELHQKSVHYTRDPLDETNHSLLGSALSTQHLIKLQSSRIRSSSINSNTKHQQSLPLGSHFINADIGASTHGSLSGSMHGLILRSSTHGGSIDGFSSHHGRLRGNSSVHGPASDSSVNNDEMIDFFYNARETRRARLHMSADLQTSKNNTKPVSSDPHARLIFSGKMDTTTREIVDQEHIIQSFYECRIAALERFTSFCVLFHAMAQYTSTPLLLKPWDTSRSQSYLRVATTASPVAAVDNDASTISAETSKVARTMLFKIKKINVNF